MTAGMVSGPSIVPLKLPSSGKKWMIDTETPIELYSETPKTLLYYTINGTKPDPFQKLGPKSTYRFSEPFFLSVGKHTVKALAVLADGSKESPVVTKTFQVQQAKGEDLPEDEEEAPQGDEESNTKYVNGSLDRPWPVAQRTSFMESLLVADEERPPKRRDDGPIQKALDSTIYSENKDQLKSINGYLIASQYLEQSSELWGKQRTSPWVASAQSIGSRREQSLGRCTVCGAPNPVSLKTSFCTTCGSTLPKMFPGHTAPAESGKMGICLSCHSTVPLNLPKCIICESPLHPENNPVLGSTEKLLCLRCGTINPLGVSKCVVCESTLTNSTNSMVKTNAPSPDQSKYLTCSKCGRVNSGNARYCDWCGSKPHPSSSVAICANCRATNPVYSKFCSGCGKDIVPPDRSGCQYSTMDGRSVRLAPRVANPLVKEEPIRWIEEDPPYSRVKPYTKSVSTQTSGLFYPSATAIEKELKAHVENMAISEASRDRKVPITAISPGKGYWRQQLDHMFHHIKVYTQNNIDFRDSIGNLRIGKLFAALAQEELDGRELMLTFSFSLKNDDKHTLKATARTVKSAMSAATAFSDGLSSKAGSVHSGTSVKKKKKKRRVEAGKGVKRVTQESKLLLKKLSKPAAGDISSFIEELVRDGADPNHQDAEGMTPLKLAVKNGWIDCLRLLIDLGSDINLQTGPKNTTPLHEAVLLGVEGLDAIEILLDNDADTESKNANGLTPYDMAVRSGLDTVMSKFASKIGKEVLNDFGK